jgi:hypothetical protein
MVDPDAHPALVRPQVIDAVGGCLPQLGVGKVMNPHRLRLSLWLPFPPSVVEVPHQLFLLGVYGDHRLLCVQKPLHLRRDVLELGVPLRVLAPFPALPRPLLTELQVPQQ